MTPPLELRRRGAGHDRIADPLPARVRVEDRRHRAPVRRGRCAPPSRASRSDLPSRGRRRRRPRPRAGRGRSRSRRGAGAVGRAQRQRRRLAQAQRRERRRRSSASATSHDGGHRERAARPTASLDRPARPRPASMHAPASARRAVVDQRVHPAVQRSGARTSIERRYSISSDSLRGRGSLMLVSYQGRLRGAHSLPAGRLASPQARQPRRSRGGPGRPPAGASVRMQAGVARIGLCQQVPRDLLAGTEQPRRDRRLAHAQGAGGLAVGETEHVHRDQRQCGSPRAARRSSHTPPASRAPARAGPSAAGPRPRHRRASRRCEGAGWPCDGWSGTCCAARASGSRARRPPSAPAGAASTRANVSWTRSSASSREPHRAHAAR